ncbi:beta strand repeat-containing protein, partial [Pedobacter psychrodurus]
MNKITQRFLFSFQKETWFKLMAFSLFLLVSISSATAQTYKTHYIAPAPWQYWSSANEIVISTNTAGTTATIKKSDGSLVTTLTPTPGNPAVYRFAGDPVGLAKNSLNTILNAAGIIVTGNNPIAVNIRNVASDDIPAGSYSSTNDQYIKGNASLFSFGDAAVGNAFRVGYYRDGDLNGVAASVSTKRPVYSILALENNTTIKLNGTAITTLNSGQSYILQAVMGSLVETSGPAVMNTGINVDAPEACGDGAYNPVPPISSLGNEYVVIRGKGNNTAEQTTIIATEANTNVTVSNFDHNGVLQSTNTYNLIAEGSFITFPNGVSTGTNTGNVQVGDASSGSRIVATKNVVAYSGTANQCEVDIATLAPLSACGGSLKAETYKFRGNNLGDLPYFAYLITKSSTDKIYLTTNGGSPVFNNTDVETIPGVGVRRQLGSSGAYAIDFENTNIGSPNSFYLSSNTRWTVAMVQSGGGFSMSNFLSPFPEKALKPTYAQADCASALLSADANSNAPFQWYLNGVAIAGATSRTYQATLSGSYTITSTLDCGISSQSLPVTIALCNVDLILTKAVDNTSPVKGGTVNFTITVKNSNIASGTVTGTGNAIGVSATDLLPSGYTYVSSVAATGTSYDPATGLWSIGSMNAGQSLILTITAKVNNSGNYNNTAVVTGSQADPVLSNNTASASVTPVNISLTSASGTDNQSICVGGTTTAIQYLITGTPVVLVTGLGPSGLNYGTTTSGGNTILTIDAGTVSNPGDYNYTVRATYASPSVTIIRATGSIIVSPQVTTPVFALGATSSRCQGFGTQTYSATASNATGITYSISPVNSGVINASTGAVTWSSVYNGTATITASAVGICGTKTANHTVTINSTGTISGAGTVCSGSNGTLTLSGAPSTVVRWESSTDNGINWTTIANTTTSLNYTNIAVTTLYRAIVSGGGCTNAASGTANVMVTPRPVIANQTYYICKTGSFTFAPIDVPNGTTYTWANPTLSSANITGGAVGTGELSVNQTLTNSGTTLQTATYTVTPIYSSCSGNPFTITVYVVPTLTASATGTTICSASAFSVTPNSNVNGTTYTWTAALTNGTASGFSNQSTDVAGPISQTLSNTSGADATVRYTVTPIYNGCSGATFTFDVIVRTATPAPTASNQTFCEISNATVANLAATGTSVKWYTQATGGTALASTTTLVNGTYYASQTLNSCESATRASITVTITATPAPTANNQTFCEISNATVANLAATGTAVKWYTHATGGTALASTTALSNGTYYASQTLNSCESATRASITVTITATPAPTANNQTFCEISNATVANLAATGTAVKWYTQATGGTALASTTALSNGTYYASQTLNSCESATRASITVTITATPAPTANNQTFCEISNATVANLAATGTAVKWYTQATGGTALASTTALTNGTYYASQTLDSCESATRASITVTITATPAPTANNQTFCEISNATVANLAATGTAVKWYTQATGGTALASTTALVNGTYYASQTLNSCESATRASITVTITATPAPTANNQTFCEISNATVANLAATGTAVKWYTQATGGTALASTTALSNGTYYASQTLNSCESATRASITVTITATLAPTANNQTFCEISNATVANLAATGTAVKWYTQATGGTALASTTALSNGTYYASQTLNSCESATRASITVTITATPAPTANNQTFCEISNATVANLAATGTAVKWYTQATGGTALASTTALVNGTYYASQTLNSCESATRASITVTITATPAPTANNQTFCEISNATVANLAATGTSVKWYTQATGGTALASTTALVNGTYYASQTLNSCESATRASITVTITATPAPTSNNQTFCEISNATVANLAATGTGVKWYTQATGGTALASTTALSNGTYYASQTLNSCESATRALITVTITATPAPTANNQTFCEISNTTVANLTATGTAVKWYMQATGGTALASTTALSNGTYYASQTLNSCESATRASITVTITATPAPTANNQTFCEISNATVANLAATGTGVKWYTQVTSGTALASTTALVNGTYYASQTLNSCESATRASITVTITATPAPTANNQTFCEISNATVANLAATGTSVKWYTSSTGGTALASTTALSNGTYYASQTLNSCESATRASITVTITATPAPTANNQTFCEISNATVANLAATGTAVKWYTQATGGTALASTTALSNGTYYASQTLNSCESATRASITVTITATPAPTANNQTFCEISNATVANLAATGTAVKWYTQATGGTALASTTALSNGTYYASQTLNSCESATRASITVTITATPAPTANNQTFCEISNATVANLAATGTAVKWYTQATGGTALASTTALSNGTYYASQTLNSCESATRSQITVTIYPTPKGFNDARTLDCAGSFSYDIQTSNINNTVNGGNSVPASFTWAVNANVTGAANGSGNTITQTLFNTSNSIQTIVYTVTPKATVTGGCVGNTFTVTVSVPVCSSISITKSANVTSVNKAGNVIAYTIVVANTGNTSQNNVIVSDPLLGGNLSNPTKTGNTDNILEKGESWTYNGSYTVLQSDLNNNGNPTNNTGKITNSASVNTTELPTAKTATADVNIALSPVVTLVKTGTLNINGNSISYLFTVKNTGNVTLNNLVVTDCKVTGPITLATSTLMPGASTTATASYTISNAEKALGSVSNTATVNGKDPLNGNVSDISGTSESNNTPAVTNTGVYAVDDEGTLNAVTGGVAVSNVLVNDKVDGNQATLANVTITQISSSSLNISIDPATGKVNVLPGTPVGTYTLVYQIEDKTKPGNVKEATVTIHLVTGVILAVDNSGSTNSVTGGTAVANVLGNDTYNGGAQAKLSNVTITNGTNDSNGKVTLDPSTGAVNVAANTPAGIYTLTYTITDKLDASKTSTATVKVTVASGVLLAKDDAGTANSVTGGTAVANVLLNDTYNGTAIAPTLNDVTITNGTNDSNGKVTLDPSTGAVGVAANTPAGVYNLTYTITDKLDASKTSTATVKVTVASGVLLAKDDAGTANSVTGGTAVANVLLNDTYNGTAIAPTLNDVT